MSSTNRGAVRADLDFYETPAWATRAILPGLELALSPPNATILDAGCGTGAILRELPAHAVGVELDPARAVTASANGLSVVCADFLGWQTDHDLIISNPPYSLAMQFVVHALARAQTVAMLLRLPWLASQGRADFHRAHPAHVHVLPRRPSFTIDGKTDSADYAWFVWHPGKREGRWSILNV